jgi:hypothetical protein
MWMGLPVADAQRPVEESTCGSVCGFSAEASREGAGVLGWVRPLPGVARRVRFDLLGPYRRDGRLVVPLRWSAKGPAGALFPGLHRAAEAAVRSFLDWLA